LAQVSGTKGKGMSDLVRVISYREPVPEGYEEIVTTSRSKNWTKGLSPFVCGPADLYDGYVAKNVENGWQFSKVYMEHIGDDGCPNDLYFEWAKEGWADNYAHRYPMGKGAKPEFSWWDGERLTYVEARKKIYMRIYSQGLRDTYAFKRLVSMVQSGSKVALRDFDGYDHKAEGLTYNEVVNNPDRKMGHAFVIAMLLDKILEANDA
jgi:hypothetical protein